MCIKTGRAFAMKFLTVLVLTYTVSVATDNEVNDVRAEDVTTVAPQNIDNVTEAQNIGTTDQKNYGSTDAYTDDGDNLLNRTQYSDDVKTKLEDNADKLKTSNRRSRLLIWDRALDIAANLKDFKSNFSKIFDVSENGIIYDYSLVIFNETKAEPVLVNEDLTLVSETLNTFEQSEKRCEKKCLSGILEGLKLSSTESLMIVVTNAGKVDASEQQILPQILSTIVDKRIRVFFILTEKCELELPRSYEQIAYLSNGQIFAINEGEFIIEFLRQLVNPERVDLLAIDKLSETGLTMNNPTKINSNESSIFVDETISEIRISAYFDSEFILETTTPNGTTFININDALCTTSSSFNRVHLCCVQKPEPGLWKISVVNATKYSLRVSAVSNMDASYAFSDTENELSHVNETLCQPPEENKNNFFVNFGNSSANASVTSAKLISQDGQVMQNFRMKRVNKTSNVFFGTFDLTECSNSSFHFQINGTTSNGTKFQRITPVAFTKSGGNITREKCLLPNILHKNESNGNANGVNIGNKTKNSTPIVIISIVVLLLILAFLIVGVVAYKLNIKSDKFNPSKQQKDADESKPDVYKHVPADRSSGEYCKLNIQLEDPDESKPDSDNQLHVNDDFIPPGRTVPNSK